jgi:methylated-DNA-protein-cysteine methyltransferase-like protein
MSNLKSKRADIFDLILEIVRQVPAGRVTTYGAIAKCIGSGGSARVVGWALHAAAGMLDVPAHRVVNSKGLLTGKHQFDKPDTMENLLKQEGVAVVDDKVKDFQDKFWDPATLV